MSIIKWKTERYNRSSIVRIECTRETEHTVWMMGRWGKKNKENKAAKISDWGRYHDSWAQAHAYLLEKAERSLVYAQKALEDAHEELRKVESLEEPDEQATARAEASA